VARASDACLLLSVVAIRVIVMGAAESGVGPTGVPASSPGVRRTTQTGQGNTVQTTTRSLTTHRTTAKTSASQTSSTSSMAAAGSPFVLGQALREMAWYVLIPAVVALTGAMVALLLRKDKPKIFDLKAVVKEMEAERDYFASSWSRKLRNAALLRYYLLMVQACSKIGILDEPTDTPHEFIGRASIELKVEASDAEKFADAVDRAHYGAELSGEEVASASRFMDSFTKVVVGRAGVG